MSSRKAYGKGYGRGYDQARQEIKTSNIKGTMASGIAGLFLGAIFALLSKRN